MPCIDKHELMGNVGMRIILNFELDDYVFCKVLLTFTQIDLETAASCNFAKKDYN